MIRRTALQAAVLALATVGLSVAGGKPAAAQFGTLRYPVGAQLIIPPSDIPPPPIVTYNVTGSVYDAPAAPPQAPPQPNLAASLPPGARMGVIDGKMYAYYQMKWYTPTYFGGSLYYSRVNPPYGGLVDSLPGGARTITVGDSSYYTVDGIYYQPVYAEGAIAYKIVAKPQGS